LSITYEKIKDVVTTPILSWKNLFGFVVLVLFACGTESFFGVIHRDSMVTANQATCSVRSVDDDGKLRLACNAPGKTTLYDSKLLVAYFKHPQPLICKLYRGNEPDCKLAS
jgi:hypothetical protein